MSVLELSKVPGLKGYHFYYKEYASPDGNAQLEQVTLDTIFPSLTNYPDIDDDAYKVTFPSGADSSSNYYKIWTYTGRTSQINKMVKLLKASSQMTKRNEDGKNELLLKQLHQYVELSCQMADFIMKNVHILTFENKTVEKTGLTVETALDIVLDATNGINKIHNKILEEYNVGSIVSAITNIQLEDVKKETNLNLGHLQKLNSQAKKSKVQ